MKWAGALVEYRVKRIQARAPGSTKLVDGSTLYRVNSLSLARDRFAKARCGDGETVAVQVVARVLERHKHNPAGLKSVVIGSGSASMPAVQASGQDAEVAAVAEAEQADDERT